MCRSTKWTRRTTLLKVGRLEQFFPLTDTWSLSWGLSAAEGPNNSGGAAFRKDNRTRMAGTDLYLKWRDLASLRYVALTAEYIYRRALRATGARRPGRSLRPGRRAREQALGARDAHRLRRAAVVDSPGGSTSTGSSCRTWCRRTRCGEARRCRTSPASSSAGACNTTSIAGPACPASQTAKVGAIVPAALVSFAAGRCTKSSSSTSS